MRSPLTNGTQVRQLEVSVEDLQNVASAGTSHLNTEPHSLLHNNGQE